MNLNHIYDVESVRVPGLWRFPANHCCIYRVPSRMRQVKPEAYTPQMVIIGPLHHNLKLEALNSAPNTKFMDYVNMEKHKRHYLEAFLGRPNVGEATIGQFRRIIEESEDAIRNSYLELTTWINSEDFVNMILYDSVFILEFFLRDVSRAKTRNTGDLLVDNFCATAPIAEDLVKLENQLPYFILERLFNPILPIISPGKTLGEFIIYSFGFEGKTGYNAEFSHFTDLYRRVYVETLPDGCREMELKPLQRISNAYKLNTGGVKFKVVGDQMSINVNFNKGCLEIPLFVANGYSETVLRNIMAFEQYHHPPNTHVCNYITFLDYLIDTEKDVDFLVEKGIIYNRSGDHDLVAKTVNKLCSGINVFDSHYSKIAAEVEAYYNKPSTKRRAFLKRVYFGNIWTGTATVAATFLLLMTLIGTVASVIQAVKLFF